MRSMKMRSSPRWARSMSTSSNPRPVTVAAIASQSETYATLLGGVADETMRDEILAQCKAAMPLDGVLLGLHGAMVAQGYDDVEGDVIERVRAI